MHPDMRPSRWLSQPQIRFVVTRHCLLLATAVFSVLLEGRSQDSGVAKTRDPSHTKARTGYLAQVNINRATVAELKTLPGVGEATAQRIVDYRTKNPPFRRIEELLIIRGISRNRLEQLRPRIRLD
jgi:competence ComEA-like helix-hairpin-helix protein